MKHNSHTSIQDSYWHETTTAECLSIPSMAEDQLCTNGVNLSQEEDTNITNQEESLYANLKYELAYPDPENMDDSTAADVALTFISYKAKHNIFFT